MNRVQAHAHFRMENHAASGILHIEPFPHSGYEHNGKFQSLALVDGHNTHRIRLLIFDTCLPIIHVILLQLFYITYKMEQSLITGGLKNPRLLCQHVKISLSLLAPRHGAGIIAIAGLLQHHMQQFMHRRIRNHLAKCLHLVQAPAQFATDGLIFASRKIV